MCTFVCKVHEDSPAQQAGLKVGECVLVQPCLSLKYLENISVRHKVKEGSVGKFPAFLSTSVFCSSTNTADHLGKFSFDSSFFHLTNKQVSSWFSQHVSASFSHQCAREQNKGDPSKASVGGECYFYLANTAAFLLDGSFIL